MPCRDGIDPADFASGSNDDTSDPVSSQLQILNLLVTNSTDPDTPVPDADGKVYARVTVGVTNINFSLPITFHYATTSGTAVSGGASPNFIGVTDGTAQIDAGVASILVPIRIYRNNSSGTPFTGQKDFTVTISSAVNATILRATATVTIDYDHIDAGGNPPPTTGLTISGPATVQAGSTAVFSVTLNPASGGVVTVNYATADGTVTGGGANPDYTSKSGTLTFAVGETGKTINVPTNAASAGGTFNVNLSSPSGASITVSTVQTTIQTASSGGGLPAAFTGWPEKDRVTYDEFKSAGGGGNRYRSACTGFAASAVASALASMQGKGSWRFDAARLYQDAGCPLCASSGPCGNNGCNPAKVPNWLGNQSASPRNKIFLVDDNAVNLGTASTKYSCLERTPDSGSYVLNTAALTGSSKADLIKNMKQAIQNNGALYMASHFYTTNDNGGTGSGWNVCRQEDGYILRPWTSNTPTGHAWCLLGWDDSVHVPAGADSSFGTSRGNSIGAFRVQSSHGCDWGEPGTGRGWFPYSLIQLPRTWDSNAPRFKYFKFNWVG